MSALLQDEFELPTYFELFNIHTFDFEAYL